MSLSCPSWGGMDSGKLKQYSDLSTAESAEYTEVYNLWLCVLRVLCGKI